MALDNKYLVITNWIIDLKDITASQKLLLAAVDNLSRKEGYCWATDKALSCASGVNFRTIQRGLEQLEEVGYIMRKTEYNSGTPERRITIYNAQNAHTQNAQSLNAQNARHENTLNHRDIYSTEKPKSINELLSDMLEMNSWHFAIVRQVCNRVEAKNANVKKWIENAVGELEAEGVEYTTLKEAKMRVFRIIKARRRDAGTKR